MKFNQIVENMRADIIKSTQELVRIRSLESKPFPEAPFGKEVRECLDKALDIGESLGFNAACFDGYAGHLEYGQGKELIGILVHMDVVPEGSGWTHDPYAGEIADGRMYGRGTMDDKGPAVAAMYALKAVKESGVDFKKRVRIIIGCDEETGRWDCMKHYFKNNEMPDCGFSPDADFPIINSEKGILIFNLNKRFNKDEACKCEGIRVNYLKGGNAPNSVPDYAECLLEMNKDFAERIQKTVAYMNEKLGRKIEAAFDNGQCLLKSYGVSAHGSTPEKGVNAVTQLINCICSLPLISGEQTDYLHFINDQIGMELDGKSLGLDMSDEVSGKLIFNLGMAEIQPEKGGVCINVRYPVTKTSEEVYGILREKIKPAGISLEEVQGKAPLYVPADNFMVKTLQSAYEEVTGEKSYLISIGGGTYSRAIKNAVAFGPMFPGHPDVVHQKDEYIGVDDLIKCTEIYAKAIYELVK